MKEQKAKFDAAVEKVKKMATDRTVTDTEQAIYKAKANMEQKKLMTLNAGVKQEEQKKVDAKNLQIKKEEEAYDKKNAITLNTNDKNKIFNDVKRISFVRPSTDKKENLNKKKEALKRTEEYAKKYRDEMLEMKAAMKYKQAAAEKARKAKLEAANPKEDYDFSEGYCRREGNPRRHDHRSRSINTQDRTACQFNCDANEDCVAFEMAPRCWWYTRDTDLKGAGQKKKECWVKKPQTATPTPTPTVDPVNMPGGTSGWTKINATTD